MQKDHTHNQAAPITLVCGSDITSIHKFALVTILFGLGNIRIRKLNQNIFYRPCKAYLNHRVLIR